MDCYACDHSATDHTTIRCHGGDTSDADGRLVDRCHCHEYAGDNE